jgi:hypothetical protein
MRRQIFAVKLWLIGIRFVGVRLKTVNVKAIMCAITHHAGRHVCFMIRHIYGVSGQGYEMMFSKAPCPTPFYISQELVPCGSSSRQFLHSQRHDIGRHTIYFIFMVNQSDSRILEFHSFWNVTCFLKQTLSLIATSRLFRLPFVFKTFINQPPLLMGSTWPDLFTPREEACVWHQLPDVVRVLRKATNDDTNE